MLDTQKRNQRQIAWTKENKDRINMTFTKGLKAELEEVCTALGVSKTQFVEAAIREKIARDYKNPEKS